MELLGCASMMVMLVWIVFEAGNSCDEEGEINKLWFIEFVGNGSSESSKGKFGVLRYDEGNGGNRSMSYHFTWEALSFDNADSDIWITGV